MVVGLWIAYLVPYKLRHRQQMLESRTDDRFSAALRVLAVTGPQGSSHRRRADVVRAVRPDCAREDQKRNGLLHASSGVRITPAVTERAADSGPDRGGSDVDRPHGTQDRIAADAARRAAMLHGAHAAATARRGAAARRRGALAGALLVATVVCWVVIAAATVPVLVAVVPTLLLATVLVLGRRAVVQGQQAEAEWQHRIAQATEEARTQQAVARPGRISAGGRAVRPSLDDTQAIARVDAGAAAGAQTGAQAGGRVWSGGREGDSWTPVPVPAPTYTTKAAAPHREPAPLGEVEGSTAAVARGAGADRTADVAGPGSGTPAELGPEHAAGPERETTAEPVVAAAGSGTTPPAPSTLATAGEPTGSIDLNAVLARRRAAGE